MRDRKFFTLLLIGGALFWALLQGAVSIAYAHPKPQPIRYRATIGVCIVAPEEFEVHTIPPEGGG